MHLSQVVDPGPAQSLFLKPATVPGSNIMENARMYFHCGTPLRCLSIGIAKLEEQLVTINAFNLSKNREVALSGRI